MLVALLTPCVSRAAPAPTPTVKTMLLVPSLGQVREIEALSRQPGSMVELLTISGHSQYLLLNRSENREFSGHVVDPSSAGEALLTDRTATVSFDDVALVYFTTPPTKPDSLVAWIPDHSSVPSLPAPGTEDRRASCAELDVELARAEAIRWHARNQGMLPFTTGEAAGIHAKTLARYTVGPFAALFAGAAGCLGCSAYILLKHPVANEELRWAVTAADRRILGLLEVKQSKQCGARAVTGTDGGDLGILKEIEGARREQAAGHIIEAALLTQETSWLDKLNPAPLLPERQPGFIKDYGEGAAATYSSAIWVPDTGTLSGLGSDRRWHGTLVLTEKTLIVQRTPNEGETTGQELRIPYADIASVDIKRKMRAHWVVVTRPDGHVDSFMLVKGLVIDPEQTEAVGVLLKSKIPPKPAAESNP